MEPSAPTKKPQRWAPHSSGPSPGLPCELSGPAQHFDLLRLAKLLGAGRTIAKPFALADMVNAVNHELSR